MNSASILQNLPQWLQATVLVLGVLSTLATAVAGLFALLAKLFPSVSFFDSAAKGIATVGVDLAAVGSWLGGVVGTKKPAAPNGFVRVRALLLVVVLGLGAIAAPLGCAAWSSFWGGKGGEVVKDEAARILELALEGKMPEEIAKIVGVDLLKVLETLLMSADPRVHATKAYAQAARVHAAMLAMPAVDGGL